jgi:hypothetical protein
MLCLHHLFTFKEGGKGNARGGGVMLVGCYGCQWIAKQDFKTPNNSYAAKLSNTM